MLAGKTSEKKDSQVGHKENQLRANSASTLVDNRPESVAQRSLQDLANSSPRVAQLRAVQEMANSSATGSAGPRPVVPHANLAGQSSRSVIQRQPIRNADGTYRDNRYPLVFTVVGGNVAGTVLIFSVQGHPGIRLTYNTVNDQYTQNGAVVDPRQLVNGGHQGAAAAPAIAALPHPPAAAAMAGAGGGQHQAASAYAHAAAAAGGVGDWEHLGVSPHAHAAAGAGGGAASGGQPLPVHATSAARASANPPPHRQPAAVTAGGKLAGLPPGIPNQIASSLSAGDLASLANTGEFFRGETRGSLNILRIKHQIRDQIRLRIAGAKASLAAVPTRAFTSIIKSDLDNARRALREAEGLLGQNSSDSIFSNEKKEIENLKREIEAIEKALQ